MITSDMEMTNNKVIINKILFNEHIFGHWVLLEKHTKLCNCSYCQEFCRFIQFRTPENKAWNSWWVLVVKICNVTYYLRIAGLFIKKEKKF